MIWEVIEKVHTNLLTRKWKHFETMTKELVWIIFYFNINTWKNLGYAIFMNQLGESTLHPSKFVISNTKKLHWVFWYVWTPQTWSPMVVKKMYVAYFMHIDFIQSSSSNHWMGFNFYSKWTLSSKMLSCTF
jgi:hypothetical protein